MFDVLFHSCLQSQSLLKGQKLPPEDCWSKVDEVLKESEFNKQVQTEFCQSLSQEDYQDISSKLQKQVDPVKFLNVSTLTIFMQYYKFKESFVFRHQLCRLYRSLFSNLKVLIDM